MKPLTNLAAGLLLILSTGPVLLYGFALATLVAGEFPQGDLRWWAAVLGTLFGGGPIPRLLLLGLASGVFLYVRGLWLGLGGPTILCSIVALVSLTLVGAVLLYGPGELAILLIMLTLLAPIVGVIVRLERARD
jgi:hypothetical protein